MEHLGQSPEGTYTFYMDMNGKEKQPIVRDAIVPFTVALEAAKEFFCHNRLPQSLRWFEL